MQAIAARISGVGTRVPGYEYVLGGCVSCARGATGAADSDSASQRARSSVEHDLRKISIVPTDARTGAHYASSPRLLFAKLLTRRPRAAQCSPLQKASVEALAAQARPDGLAAVDSHLKGLPEPVRTALLMRHIQRMSLTDIAATLGVPVETVSEHLRQGLRAIYAGACTPD